MVDARLTSSSIEVQVTAAAWSVDHGKGTAVLPNPNNFEGATRLWNGTPEPVELATPQTFGARGIGVLDLARAIRADRTERASGELAYHVLDVMISIAESAERHESMNIQSTAEPPQVLPDDWNPLEATL